MSDGTDVRQLEENLLLLGYTRKGDEIDRHWDDDTTAAVKRWQRDRGQTADGEIELGEVVFLPEAIRVTEIKSTTRQPGRTGRGAPGRDVEPARRLGRPRRRTTATCSRSGRP